MGGISREAQSGAAASMESMIKPKTSAAIRFRNEITKANNCSQVTVLALYTGLATTMMRAPANAIHATHA